MQLLSSPQYSTVSAVYRTPRGQKQFLVAKAADVQSYFSLYLEHRNLRTSQISEFLVSTSSQDKMIYSIIVLITKFTFAVCVLCTMCGKGIKLLFQHSFQLVMELRKVKWKQKFLFYPNLLQQGETHSSC